jgi:hypothetical protein
MRRALSVSIFVIACAIGYYTNVMPYVTLNNYDTYPIFTSVYCPDYLTRNLRLAWLEDTDYYQEYIQFSLSPFYQSADTATNQCKIDVPLGDIYGRWAMPPLFYPEEFATGQDPASQTFIQQELIDALSQVVPGDPTLAQDLATTCSAIINPGYLDSNKEFGFFSVAERYRKHGIRFQLDWLFFNPVGLRVQTGWVDIKLIPCFTDLTCSATGLQCPGTANTCTPPEPCTVDNGTAGACLTTAACVDTYPAYCKMVMIDKIMKQRDTVAQTLGLNTSTFENRGMEDLYLQLFWRMPYEVNKDRPGWPLLLATPYFTFNISVPTGVGCCSNALFCLPTGNKGHTGLGFTMGATLDFIKSVEIGGELEVMQYNTKNICMPVPTQPTQVGFLPRMTTLRVHPGISWAFNLSLNAYHFLGRLSGYAQYVWVGHGQDSFLTINSTTNPANIAFDTLIENSKWDNQLINLGLTYDISPFLALGFAWQAPGPRRNAFRSNTVLVSLVGTF